MAIYDARNAPWRALLTGPPPLATMPSILRERDKGGQKEESAWVVRALVPVVRGGPAVGVAHHAEPGMFVMKYSNSWEKKRGAAPPLASFGYHNLSSSREKKNSGRKRTDGSGTKRGTSGGQTQQAMRTTVAYRRRREAKKS